MNSPRSHPAALKNQFPLGLPLSHFRLPSARKIAKDENKRKQNSFVKQLSRFRLWSFVLIRESWLARKFLHSSSTTSKILVGWRILNVSRTENDAEADTAKLPRVWLRGWVMATLAADQEVAGLLIYLGTPERRCSVVVLFCFILVRFCNGNCASYVSVRLIVLFRRGCSMRCLAVTSSVAMRKYCDQGWSPTESIVTREVPQPHNFYHHFNWVG